MFMMCSCLSVPLYNIQGFLLTCATANYDMPTLRVRLKKQLPMLCHSTQLNCLLGVYGVVCVKV